MPFDRNTHPDIFATAKAVLAADPTQGTQKERTALVRAFLVALDRADMGAALDGSFTEYVTHANGEPCFTSEDAAYLDSAVSAAFSLTGEYIYGMQIGLHMQARKRAGLAD